MQENKTNLLITGRPGIGKTTLIRRIAGHLTELEPAGFVTDEIREKGARKGFSLISLDGSRRGVLAHVEIESRYRVGRYRVDISGFESFVDQIGSDVQKAPLVFIDEIGKMECLSRKFRDFILARLDSPQVLVATVAQRGGAFIEACKVRSDVELLIITERNREALVNSLAADLRSRLKR
jgi:nucleoside-triphosphatase